MTLVFTLLTIAVAAVAAAVALGMIGGGLDAPASSLPPVGLPDGPLQSQDLSALKFAPALRGYRMDQVDATITRLADELAERDAQIAALTGHGELTSDDVDLFADAELYSDQPYVDDHNLPVSDDHHG